MKNTCVVKIDRDDDSVKFYPDTDGAAYLSAWPGTLRRKFRVSSVYSIQCVGKPTSRSVRTTIVGVQDQSSTLPSYGIPAFFVTGDYGICAEFLHKLGVTPPPEGKRKTLHLVVTKRRT